MELEFVLTVDDQGDFKETTITLAEALNRIAQEQDPDIEFRDVSYWEYVLAMMGGEDTADMRIVEMLAN